MSIFSYFLPEELHTKMSEYEYDGSDSPLGVRVTVEATDTPENSDCEPFERSTPFDRAMTSSATTPISEASRATRSPINGLAPMGDYTVPYTPHTYTPHTNTPHTYTPYFHTSHPQQQEPKEDEGEEQGPNIFLDTIRYALDSQNLLKVHPEIHYYIHMKRSGQFAMESISKPLTYSCTKLLEEGWRPYEGGFGMSSFAVHKSCLCQLIQSVHRTRVPERV